MAQVVVVGDAPLALDDLVAVAQLGAPVEISNAPEVAARVQRSHDQVAQWAAQGVLLYGVTTRYGGLATSRLSLDEARELQRATVWVHKTAAGRPIDRRDVRGAMLLRMNSLLHGVSGIRLELIRRLEVFLNRGITPRCTSSVPLAPAATWCPSVTSPAR